MNECPFCNGKLEETDQYGSEQECELCGTTFKVMPMERKDESTE